MLLAVSEWCTPSPSRPYVQLAVNDPCFAAKCETPEYCNMSTTAGENWSPLAERRLFKQLLDHKPAGVSKRFQMTCLTVQMNHIYDDDDSDIEELLSKDDAQVAQQHRSERPVGEESSHWSAKAYAPVYSLRPQPREIWRKLNELYDMDSVEMNEYIPDEFELQSDFFLPDGDFSELLRLKEEEIHNKNTISRQHTPQPPPPPRTSV
uniref:Uncharacterized protein n=1 Tax=Plectus sambesii TaxID=2011161 RepID=A0A914UMA6_9BILA